MGMELNSYYKDIQFRRLYRIVQFFPLHIDRLLNILIDTTTIAVYTCRSFHSEYSLYTATSLPCILYRIRFTVYFLWFLRNFIKITFDIMILELVDEELD